LSLRSRIQSLHTDERGFALVLAISLTTLITLTAVSIMTLSQGENTNSRRDQARDGAFQAAEAGTNAYLSDLTQSTVFYNAFMAKGEATRTDSSNVTHTNPCTTTCTDAAWNALSWGTTWTYKTALASDTDWYNMGNGYDYLIKVYPPSASYTGLAQVITRIDVTGRPHGGTDVTKWHTIETMIRPSSLTDFQAFVGSDLSYAVGATTTGPVFVGEDDAGNKHNLNHDGTAKANLYAEGSVTGSTTLLNGAKKYDKNSSPTALCKLNNCTPVPFSSLQPTIPSVKAAAVSGTGGNIYLGTTDTTNSALSGQSPAYSVTAWKLNFLTTGYVQISSCKKAPITGTSPQTYYEDYDGLTPPVCGTAQTVQMPTTAQGAIYSDTDIIVSGVVNGTVTVGSGADIIYGGSLTYAQNGSDVIGLEAQGTIYIARWAPDANGDITLYGAQFSRTGPWTADPKSPCTSSPSYCHSVCGTSTKCTMTFYGSSALEGQSGSAISMSAMFNHRNYNYDPNLLFLPPPFWPSLGNAFTILVQREL
jgi:Tfp pilus assembly protein PilX